MDALDAIAAPNCPADLVSMVLDDGRVPRWRCPSCGLTAIA